MSEVDRIAAAFLPLQPPGELLASAATASRSRPVFCVVWLALAAAALLLLAAHVVEFPLDRGGRLIAWWSAVAFYVRTFQFHAGCAALACAIGFAIRGRFVTSGSLAFVTTVAMIPELRVQWPAIDAAERPAQLRLFSVNQLRGNRDTARTIDAIRAENPDVIAIQEYHSWHDETLAETLKRDYPHAIRYPYPLSNGLAVYSRFPMEIDREPAYLFCRERAISVWITVGSTRVRLFNIHPTSPGFPRRIAENRRQMSQLLDALRGGDEAPTLVVGDCNFPLNSQQADALKKSGFSPADELAGEGVRWTWSPLRDGPPVTRIDHVFVSRHFAVESNRVLDGVGSDHRPIVVDLRLR